jgi:predicted site-specific integrase-resolvase
MAPAILRHAARQLATSPVSLRRWHRQGKLPLVRLPSGAFRADPEVIARIIADGLGAAGDVPDTGPEGE